MKRPNASGRRPGFTLTEMSIGLAMLVVLTNAAFVVGDSVTKTIRMEMTTGLLDAASNRAMTRIVERLRQTSMGTVAPLLATAPFSTPVISIERVTGYANQAPLLANREVIRFVYTAQDPDDGIDNDGDGVIDEGRVILIQDAGLATQKIIVLAENVREALAGEILGNGVDDNGNGLIDERGFCINHGDGQITVRLSLEGVTHDGVVITRTLERSIRVVNDDT